MRSVVKRPRAERFEVRVPARVRPCGHATWRDADIVNVSRSGVLLALSSAFPPAETIDVEFTLPASSSSDIRRVGHIVRETSDGNGRALIAASFEEHL